MSQHYNQDTKQNKKAEIEIPPRYETLGRTRPSNFNSNTIMRNGTVQSHMSNTYNEVNSNPYTNNLNYPVNNNVYYQTTLQRQYANTSSINNNQNYRNNPFPNSRFSPPSSSSRMSVMSNMSSVSSMSGMSNMSSSSYGTQNYQNYRQPISQSLHQLSPQMNATRYQMLRTRTPPNLNQPNHCPSNNNIKPNENNQQNHHYPIIPTRDVSRQNAKPSRHNPSSSISSISSIRTDISNISLTPPSIINPEHINNYNNSIITPQDMEKNLSKKTGSEDQSVVSLNRNVMNNTNTNTNINGQMRNMNESLPLSLTTVMDNHHNRSKSSSPPSSQINSGFMYKSISATEKTNPNTPPASATYKTSSLNNFDRKIKKYSSETNLSNIKNPEPCINTKASINDFSSLLSRDSKINIYSNTINNQMSNLVNINSNNNNINVINNKKVGQINNNSNTNLDGMERINQAKQNESTISNSNNNSNSSNHYHHQDNLKNNNHIHDEVSQVNESSSPQFSRKRNNSENTPPLTPLFTCQSPSCSSVFSTTSSYSSSSPMYSPLENNDNNNSPEIEKKTEEIIIPPRKNLPKNYSRFSTVSSVNSNYSNYSNTLGNETIDISNTDSMMINEMNVGKSSYNSTNSGNTFYTSINKNGPYNVHSGNNSYKENKLSNHSSGNNDNTDIVLPVRTKASLNANSKSHENSTSDLTESPLNSDEHLNSNILLTRNTTYQSDNIYLEGEMREKFPLIEHSPLLSEIAEKFRASITLIKQIKDSIEYSDCFSGAMAVTILSTILGTTDRKLALSIGRSLESQLFFHDVVYTNRLLDSNENIYQMQGRTVAYDNDSKIDISSLLYEYIESPDLLSETPGNIKENQIGSNQNSIIYKSKVAIPTGVYVAIAECYSPTCSDTSPCYSWSCPRRRTMEKVISKSKVKKDSSTSKVDTNNDSAWSTTIGKSMLDKVDDHERKRQEIIYEFIQSEKDYVDDLLHVKNLIIRPLRSGIINKIGSQFVDIVFGNIEEILDCNSKFSKFLQDLQTKEAIIDILKFGEIVKEAAQGFTCYIKYGEVQPLAKQILQIHKSNNNMFELFLKEIQSKKEFRRLPLESFLARPTTRLGRYPILIKDILKHTQEANDQIALKSALNIIENILKNVNEKAGKTTNKIKLEQWSSLLDGSTIEKREEILVLQLQNPGREFIREGTLLLKKENNTLQEVDIVLLNNALVITRKRVNSIEIIRKPIPIQLLKIINEESMEPRSNSNSNIHGTIINEEKYYSFVAVHIGYKQYTFCTKVFSEQKSWIEVIEERIRAISAPVIETFNIVQHYIRINSSVMIKDNVMIFASDNGLYSNIGQTLTMILPLPKITQIDAMPDVNLLFVLIDREIIPYSIDSLLKGDLVSNFKKPRKLCSGISFMVVGRCDGHYLLCAVKSANTNSTIKTYEPNQPLIAAITNNSIKLKVSTIDVLTPYKQFYIPAEAKSIQFLKRALCIGCIKGFEVVDINTLTTQSLFDAHEPAYEKILKADYKPVKVIKTNKSDFLVCYNRIGFFLDKNGNRSRQHLCFAWINQPTSFAYIPPYILAFAGDYIEVWNENNSYDVQQIIYGYSFKQLKNSIDDGIYIISGYDTQIISRIILARKR